MKKNWISILIFVLSVNGFSQTVLDANSQEAIFEHAERSTINDSKNQIINLSNTNGSPYLNESFLSGIVTDEILDESLGYQMRYNIYNDEIEVENSADKSIVSIKKNSRYSCKIVNDTFKYIEYLDENNTPKKAYFLELLNGKVSFLLKYTCTYQPEKIGKPPVYQVTPAKFTTTKSYYLLSKDQLTLISTKKKKFLENFGEYKGQVNSYINKNKLRMNNDRDLVRVITFYNSLLEKDASNN